MRDRSISATITASATLWALGALGVLLGAFVNHAFADCGLYLTLAAMAFSIRRMFCQQTRRDRAMFDLGREVGKVHAIR